MVAVICFLWGNWPGGPLGIGIDYVRRLRNMVERNTTIAHDFLCFTDSIFHSNRIQREGIDSRWISVHYLRYEWNLRKMFMFDALSNLKKYDWVVCMDLDMVILKDIDSLLTYRSGKLVTCRGAYRPDIGGSIVGFSPEAYWSTGLVSYLSQNKELIEDLTGGSERKFYARCVSCSLIPQVEFWQDLLPGKIRSYKVDGYSEEASIIRFHGSPRPHQVDPRPEWMKENWR